MTEDFRRRGLIVNDRVEEYDGGLETARQVFARYKARRAEGREYLPA